jgi:hypothetical protein
VPDHDRGWSGFVEDEVGGPELDIYRMNRQAGTGR